MRLIVKYNRYAVTFMIIVFVFSSVGSFFLIRDALTKELDISLLRVQARINKSIANEQQIPTINGFDDEKIIFEKSGKPVTGNTFNTVQTYIREQNKLHISRQLTYGILLNQQQYKVTITDPLEGTKHMFLAMFEITLVTILLLIITISVINRVVMKKLWSPFYQSVDQLHEFNISKPTRLNFPKTNIEEFTFLISNLEITTTNAVENYRILKEFTENASHEIQTPLAIVHSQLDLLLQDDGLNGEQSEHLIIAYQALKRLSRLNKSLLLIAKIDNHQFYKTAQIDLKYKVTDKIREFNELWLSKNIDVTTDLSDAFINADPELIDIMLNNLFSNSCKHNLVDGTANIQLRSGNLTIVNTGKTEALDPQRIFTRFYKEEAETNNGLGLSIIKKICDQTGIKPQYDFDHMNGEHIFTLNW